jgi:Na+-transporting methylmalonyl-CoA/oxaloacetate decarboxylase gamma subunit
VETENLSQGLQIVGVGVGGVFVNLLVLMFALYLVGMFFGKKPAKGGKGAGAKKKPAAKGASASTAKKSSAKGISASASAKKKPSANDAGAPAAGSVSAKQPIEPAKKKPE